MSIPDPASMNFPAWMDELRRSSGAHRPMGLSSARIDRAHYHLLRRFKGEVDLLAILNTKRCVYNCSFCDLPTKSSADYVSPSLILAQVSEVARQYADVIHVVDRVTLSNEGSVLDDSTFDRQTLLDVVSGFVTFPNVSRIVLETRPEFITRDVVSELRLAARRATLDFLVGFETINDRIRNVTLGKRQSRQSLSDALDAMASVPGTCLTSYVLLKPDYRADDEAAVREAKQTIEYLLEVTAERGLPLAIRLNPMYLAESTRWTQKARSMDFMPPRIQDALEIARWSENLGVSTYIGLSSEGLASDDNNFRVRDDFDRSVYRDAIVFNSAARRTHPGTT